MLLPKCANDPRTCPHCGTRFDFRGFELDRPSEFHDALRCNEVLEGLLRAARAQLAEAEAYAWDCEDHDEARGQRLGLIHRILSRWQIGQMDTLRALQAIEDVVQRRRVQARREGRTWP